jgi:hypothetical protein
MCGGFTHGVRDRKERSFAAEMPSAQREQENAQKDLNLFHKWFVTGHGFSRAVMRRGTGVLTPAVS